MSMFYLLFHLASPLMFHKNHLGSVPEKFNVLFPTNVTPAFNPKAGFQEIGDPSTKVCGVDA